MAEQAEFTELSDEVVKVCLEFLPLLDLKRDRLINRQVKGICDTIVNDRACGSGTEQRNHPSYRYVTRTPFAGDLRLRSAISLISDNVVQVPDDANTVSRVEDLIRDHGWGMNTWDVSEVESLRWLVRNDGNFNGKIGSWNVAAVTDMESAFDGATNFNQDISGWDTGHVQSMRRMFTNASSFNQDISSWNVTAVTNFDSMFNPFPHAAIAKNPVIF